MTTLSTARRFGSSRCMRQVYETGCRRDAGIILAASCTDIHCLRFLGAYQVLIVGSSSNGVISIVLLNDTMWQDIVRCTQTQSRFHTDPLGSASGPADIALSQRLRHTIAVAFITLRSGGRGIDFFYCRSILIYAFASPLSTPPMLAEMTEFLWIWELAISINVALRTSRIFIHNMPQFASDIKQGFTGTQNGAAGQNSTYVV